MNRSLVLCAVFWMSVLALWGVGAYKVATRPVIETDILALLPQNENSALVKYAEKQTAQSFQRNILILIGDTDVQKAVAAANALREKLAAKDDLFAKVETRIDPKDIQSSRALYIKHSAAFISPRQQDMLENNDIAAIRKSVIAKIYGGGFIPDDTLRKDPLLFSDEAITQIIAKNVGNYVLIDDVPTVTSGAMHYALLRIELEKNPFSLAYQARVLNALDDAQSELIDTRIIRSGLIFHAINGAEQAKSEISVMGTLSLAGVFLLLTLTFKSLRPFFFSAIMIIGGGICGFTACLLFFDKVHLLTLVFGTSLVGISIDYTLHFFAHKFEHEEWDSRKVVHHIFPGITLGLITSIIGFLSLCLTPFPSLQQMAIFSIAGLVFVYGAVVFLYPPMFKIMPQSPNPLLFNVSAALLKWFQGRNHGRAAVIVLVTIGVMAAALPFLKGQDDVRAMQSLSPQLVKNDADIGRLIGSAMAAQFFVVSGDSDNDLLRNIQSFTDTLKGSSTVERYQSLIDYIPPSDTQGKNIALLQNFVAGHRDDLKALFKELSMPDGTYDDYLSYLKTQSPLPLAAFMQSIRGGPASMLDGRRFEGERIGIITLVGIKDTAALMALANDFPHVIFVDKVAGITAAFDHHRIMATRLIIAAYLLILGFLYFRYGLRKSALILAPSVLASLTAIIAVVLLGGHYSLFHVLALFLVMGIGVDYGLFLIESDRAKHNNATAMTAILLSGVTTLLSFGLLTMSATSALHDFGLTIVVGIICTFLLSPIVLSKDES